MMINDYCENVKGIALMKKPISVFVHDGIVTDNPTILRQLQVIEKAAASSVPIMIFGEKGSEKSLYAKYVHDHSPRKNNQFSDIKCSTIPEGFFERTFFGGDVWSSFGSEGILKRTNYGTLFLSDIDLMPSDIQYKLYEAVNGQKSGSKIDVRIVASIDSDKDKEPFYGMIEELYFLLNIVRIDIPDLSSRREDILLMIFYFLDEINNDYRMKKEISWEMLCGLLETEWDGKIKQLKNTVSKLVWMTDGDLISNPGLLKDATTLQKEEYALQGKSSFTILPDDTPKTLKELVHDYEILIIRQYIQKYGSLRKAAAALGASPASLSRKLNLEHLQE